MKFPIPETVLERHLAILGINGSGKTSVAKAVIAEPLLDAGQRIAVIDPTGVWWGLRLKADGRRPAFDVAIFGGPHGDLPLNAHSGKTVAEAIGTSATPVVLDTIAMTVRERSQFFTDFAETLLRTNKGPLNLIIDECHLFMPQGGAKSGGQVPDMLHAGNNLVSLGRSKGIRVTMITQRPAKLHKDSLTQALTLIAMQVVHPLDREAIEDWIKDNADKAQSKEIVSSLGGLKPGEAWVWSPRINLLDRKQFDLPKTLDTSSGDDTDAALPAMNLDAIKAKLGKVADDLKANDPRALKAEIARLKADAAKKPTPVNDAALQDAAHRTGFNQGRAEGYREGWEVGWSGGWIGAIRWAQTNIAEVLKNEGLTPPPALSPPKIPKSDAKYAEPMRAPITPIVRSVERPSAPPSHANDHEALNGPQRRIIASLSFWRSIGYDAPTREQVAVVAGYSPIGGAFGNPIGQLRSAGFINYPRPGVVCLTDAAPFEEISREQARDKLLGVLDGPQKKLVAAFDNRDGDVTRQEIAEAAGYSPIGGAFGNPAGALCTLGIFEKPSPGMLRLSDWAREVLS